MPNWVCLLRGVNVGGHNRVNMPTLRGALSRAGFGEVRSYIQSGNLLVSSNHRLPTRVQATVGEVIRAEFGLDVDVVVRTPAQLAAIVDWCPFPDQAAQAPALVHVLHLAAAPAAERVAELLTQDWAPDHLAVAGAEVVLAFAGSMHESRMQYPAVLRTLGVSGTARNWRTLLALVQLSAGRPPDHGDPRS